MIWVKAVEAALVRVLVLVSAVAGASFDHPVSTWIGVSL